MVYEIIWTEEASATYLENLHYLKSEWTEKEVNQFIAVVKEKLDVLMVHPTLGTATSIKRPNVRRTIVHKRILLYYRVKERKGEIELLRFWNTYQNPAKLNNK